jgi:hypothetical protein
MLRHGQKALPAASFGAVSSQATELLFTQFFCLSRDAGAPLAERTVPENAPRPRLNVYHCLPDSKARATHTQGGDSSHVSSVFPIGVCCSVDALDIVTAGIGIAVFAFRPVTQRQGKSAHLVRTSVLHNAAPEILERCVHLVPALGEGDTIAVLLHAILLLLTISQACKQGLLLSHLAHPLSHLPLPLSGLQSPFLPTSQCLLLCKNTFRGSHARVCDDLAF